ncbi:MAG: YkgJ family cysteine cluster protein [Rhodocyclaceae bacterium]|nr:YkgJ family cysteine cluster protein [Rhodocyclaceae bacterium]
MPVAPNPCQSCGACCAAFRVVFAIGELDSFDGGDVPVSLADPLTPATACMRGTERQPPRCIALVGEIGHRVECAIYRQRPGPCREFAPLAALGRGGDACDEARRRHGLRPLSSLADIAGR